MTRGVYAVTAVYVLAHASHLHTPNMGWCERCQAWSPCEGIMIALHDQKINDVEFWMSHGLLWTVYLANEGEAIICDSQWYESDERTRLVFDRHVVASGIAVITDDMPKPRLARSAIAAAYEYVSRRI